MPPTKIRRLDEAREDPSSEWMKCQKSWALAYALFRNRSQHFSLALPVRRFHSAFFLLRSAFAWSRTVESEEALSRRHALRAARFSCHALSSSGVHHCFLVGIARESTEVLRRLLAFGARWSGRRHCPCIRACRVDVRSVGEVVFVSLGDMDSKLTQQVIAGSMVYRIPARAVRQR